MKARAKLATGIYADSLREFLRMRAGHRDLMGQLAVAKRVLLDLRDEEIPEIEVAAVLNNNPATAICKVGRHRRDRADPILTLARRKRTRLPSRRDRNRISTRRGHNFTRWRPRLASRSMKPGGSSCRLRSATWIRTGRLHGTTGLVRERGREEKGRSRQRRPHIGGRTDGKSRGRYHRAHSACRGGRA